MADGRDTQAKPFLWDRRSSSGQLWLELSPTPLNLPWTAGHSRISAVQSGSGWLDGQAKVSSSSSQTLPIIPYIVHPHEDLPNPGIEPTPFASPALADRFFTTEPPEILTWAKATPVRTKIPASLRPRKFVSPLPGCKPVSTWELIRVSILPVNMSKKKKRIRRRKERKEKEKVNSMLVLSCTVSPSPLQMYVHYSWCLWGQLEILIKSIFLMTFSTPCSYITVNKWNLLNVPLKCDVIFVYKTFSISIHRAEHFWRLISLLPERNDPVEDGAASRCD